MKPRWQKIGLLLLLVCGGFLFVQAALRWGTNYYLRERAKIPLQLGRLFINPATSRATLALQGEDPRQKLDLDLGQIRFDWWQVILKRLRLGHVKLEGVALDILKGADGGMTVGGIRLASEPSASTTTTQSTPSSWKVGTGPVDLANIRIHYRDPQIDVLVLIHELHVDPAESWNPNTPTPFHTKMTINGGLLTLRGTCKPFLSDPTVEAKVELIALPLAWLSEIAKASGVARLDGRLGLNLDVTAEVHLKESTQDIRWNGNLDFDHVQIGGPKVGLSLVEMTGRWNFDAWKLFLSSRTTTFAAHGFTIAPETRVLLRDDQYHPPFRLSIPSLGMKLGAFDMASPSQATDFALNVVMGRFEKLSLKGVWSPFAGIPDGKVNLHVDGLNLTAFSPMTQQAIGYKLETGLFDLKTNIDVKRGMLEATNGFVAHKLHFNKLASDQLDPSASQIGLPLNLCLSLIRDADDNIRLDIPLTGDLTDPKVPVGKLVWTLLGKAVISALRSAATAFFPSGGKLGFDPMVFAPGDTALTPEAMTYLGKVGGKLAQKPEVALKVTGMASLTDWYALERRKAPEPLVALAPEQVTAAQKEKMLLLAQKRAEAMRGYLVDQYHIDPKRILDTAPQMDLNVGTVPSGTLSL